MSCPAVIHVYANLGLPKAVVVTTLGPVGPIGSRWLGGTAAPAANLGVVGDWYIRSTGAVYGPKTEAGWGSVVFTLQVPLSTAPAQPLAALAAAGSSGLAADAGHQHPFPSAVQVGADPQGTASTAVAGHLQAQPHLTAQQAAAAAPVQSVALSGPAGWSTSSTNNAGSVTLSLALPAGSSLVSGSDRTDWDLAYDERRDWDGGSTNLNPATGRASLQLGTAAQASTGDFATAAQGSLAASAVQPSDSRLSDSREWSATTVDQAEAEAGIATTRRAWTSQRVRQAVAAWWLATGSVFGRNWAALANAAAGRLALELGTLAQGNAASPPALGGTTPAAGAFTNLSASVELTLPSGAPATPTARDLYAVAETIRYRDTSNIERMLLNNADNLANLANITTARANIGAAALYPARQTITAAANVYTVDVTSGVEFITAAAINGAVTINLSNLNNIPANGVWQGRLKFAYTSGLITWFSGNTGFLVKWAGGLPVNPRAGDWRTVFIEVVGGGSIIEARDEDSIAIYSAYVQDYINKVLAADFAAGNALGLERGVTDAYSVAIEAMVGAGFLAVSGGVISSGTSTIKAMCFMHGARTLAGALVPVVGVAPINVNFVEGDYNRRLGLGDPVNATKYLNLNRNNNADPQDSQSVSFYIASGTTGNMGVLPVGATGQTAIFVNATSTAATSPFRSRSGGSVPGTRSTAGATGFIGLARGLSGSFISRDGGTNETITFASQSPGAGNLFLFARNNLNTGTVDAYSNMRCPFYHVGLALSLSTLQPIIDTLVASIAAAIP